MHGHNQLLYILLSIVVMELNSPSVFALTYGTAPSRREGAALTATPDGTLWLFGGWQNSGE